MNNGFYQDGIRRITTPYQYQRIPTARSSSVTCNKADFIYKMPGRTEQNTGNSFNVYNSNRNVSAMENDRRLPTSSYQRPATSRSSFHSVEPLSRNSSHFSSCTSNDVDKCGLIILGNAGVGKSFLGNILLGREAFAHEFSAGSVTHTTEYHEIEIGDFTLAIFNIPGLIEADQNRINLNKREIEKAFLARPNSIVLYVFGNQRGRLRDEDVIAFNAINAAYSFREESLVLVLNDLDKDRPSDYEGTTLVLLRQLLPHIKISERNVCFLNRIDRNNLNQKQMLKEQLLAVTVRFIPTIHRKQQEIQTTRDHLEAEKQKIQNQQAQFQAERSKFLTQIQNSQARLNATIAKHQTEAESYKKAIEKQREMISEQQAKFETERRQHISQMKELRAQTNQAQSKYNQLCQSDTASQRELRAYREELNKLRQAYEQLNRRVPQQSSKKSSCVIS